MANKFAKAVEKRFDEEKVQIENTKSEAKGDKVEIVENESTFDIMSIIHKEEKSSRNKTYYLDDKVIDEVAKIAKKQKISESKIVNDILKHVLFGKQGVLGGM